ncbi:MAG: flagellar filament capping protein FliD [Clostridiales bacterium]|nr:flagellar filament capping protein FliD [Clostridiales bacterium]
MSSLRVNSVSDTASVVPTYETKNYLIDKKETGVFETQKTNGTQRLYRLQAPQPDYNKQSAVNYKDANSEPRFNAVKQISGELKKTADAITEKFPPIYEQLVASLDNEESVQVTGVNSASAQKDTAEVEVSRLARSQENEGKPLKSNNSDFERGNNRFEIENKNGSSKFNINVAENDDNKTVQNKAANAINRRDIGVKASVTEGNGNMSALVLKSKETGAENGFAVYDTDENGITEKLGVTEASQEAQDAKFTVNGEEKTSASNSVYIGNGISAVLKGVSEKPTQINLSKDTEGIKSKVSEFVTSFNDLMKTARENLESDKLTNKLKSAFNSNSQNLEESGFTLEDYRLKTDESKLTQSISEGDSLEKALGSPNERNGGFARDVSLLARNTQANPAGFADGSSILEENLAAGASLMHMGLYNSIA